MFDTLFGEGQYALKMLFAFIVVFGLLALALWLVRRFGGDRVGSATARGRQPRLAVIDAATVDGRRRLVLIRRDNVEHLLMIGGPTDVVVEPNIVRGTVAAREAPSPRPLPASEALPRPVPLGEGSMWPLQPEPAPRPEPPARAEPAPRPQRPAPMVEEPAQWPPPEPDQARPPPPPPRDRRPRPDPLAGLADELSRAPAGGVPSDAEPAPRPAPRREPRARPQSGPSPTPTAAGDGKFASAADQNLAEMAQRLEAALRRPGKSEEGTPPAPMESVEPAEPEDVAPRARAAAPAESTKPARSDTKTSRGEAKPPPQQKSVYDSLEQEMASLLGRPNNKG
jgi:flagellar protein FliO/FliZ